MAKSNRRLGDFSRLPTQAISDTRPERRIDMMGVQITPAQFMALEARPKQRNRKKPVSLPTFSFDRCS